MRASLSRSILLASVAGMGILLCACESSKHTMVAPAAGTKAMCRMCYDEVQKVRTQSGRSVTGTNVTIKRHQCPDCKTEMSIYTENGVLMVKCAMCAPAGMACDKCVAPAK